MKNQDENISSALGEILKELRDERGWKQKELAEKSDLHTNYISLLERGKRNATLQTVFKLAKAFNISVTSIVNRVEEALQED